LTYDGGHFSHRYQLEEGEAAGEMTRAAIDLCDSCGIMRNKARNHHEATL
jgi:hypothetical protein